MLERQEMVKQEMANSSNLTVRAMLELGWAKLTFDASNERSEVIVNQNPAAKINFLHTVWEAHFWCLECAKIKMVHNLFRMNRVNLPDKVVLLLFLATRASIHMWFFTFELLFIVEHTINSSINHIISKSFHYSLSGYEYVVAHKKLIIKKKFASTRLNRRRSSLKMAPKAPFVSLHPLV